MPIVIGEKRESDFTDPIGMLGDCHRRILRFMHVLVSVAAQQQGAPLADERRTLLLTSLRYFRDAAPKHTADEEESLFPRLRRLDSHAIDTMLARIKSLEQDQECASRSHAELDRLGQLWLSDGRLSPMDAAQFQKLAGQLELLYRHHIDQEDKEVFPLAARVLPAADLQAIGHEMAARRGVSNASSRRAANANEIAFGCQSVQRSRD
jgi:hemerythrin-like domain-containing protein